MKKHKLSRIWLWALGGLALCFPVAALISAIQVLIPPNQGMAKITIANASNESIVGGEVEALGMIYPFSSIPSGQRASVRFPITGEGSYRIHARLESDRAVDNGAGRYVVPGFGIEDRADVTNVGINIRAIRPFRVKLLRKNGSETLTPQIIHEPLPVRREVIDVEVYGRTTKAVAHLLTWASPAPQQSSAPIAVVVAVETD